MRKNLLIKRKQKERTYHGSLFSVLDGLYLCFLMQTNLKFCFFIEQQNLKDD